jgi:hypothetical protein
VSGGREQINPDVVKAVEEVALRRDQLPTDKELMAKHGLSRTSLFRIMRAARRKFHVELKHE